MEEKAIKTGIMGAFNGWRVGGKSFDAEGNETPEIHEKDCLCCRDRLFAPPPTE